MKIYNSNVLQLLEFYIYHKDKEGNIIKGRYGINVAKVQEVRKLPELTLMPNVAPFIPGVFDLRGKVILTLDLAQYMGLNEVPQSSKKVIITEFSNILFGIIIHNANRILYIPYENIESPPEIIKEQYNNDISAIAKVREIEDDFEEQEKNSEQEKEVMILIVDFESVATKIGLIKPVEETTVKNEENQGTIMIVDDSSIARKQMSSVLKQQGFNVIEAIDGLDAQNKINQAYLELGDRFIERFQLLVSDIEMPRMDGITLTRNLKNDRRFKKLPIIIHSSISGSANIEKGKKVGCDHYLVKFDPVEFIETINKLKIKL